MNYHSLVKPYQVQKENARGHDAAYTGWTAAQEQELLILYKGEANLENIAATLQRSVGAVRSRLHRLRVNSNTSGVKCIGDTQDEVWEGSSSPAQR